jgi:glycosyltransferase involved in cell wall biosynthesis
MLSLAVTTYNRFDLTIQSFNKVINDSRISDILILDDASTDNSYEKLRKHFENIKKVKVTRQAHNRGMSKNKRDAISLVEGPWVLILDSDNVISSDYLDALEEQWFMAGGAPNRHRIYAPDFAKPDFDYRKYSGQQFGGNKPVPIHENAFNCLMNTCNFVVNQSEYLKVYKPNDDMKATDTVWFNYLWLLAGNSFFVVPGMEYEHRMHSGSGFLQDVDYNMKKSEEVRKLIMAL